VFFRVQNYSIRMSKSVKIFVGISFCALFGLAGYIFYFDQTVFVFRDVQMSVTGEQWHSEMLRQTKTKWLVRFLAHKDKNLWQVPLNEINQRLMQDPSVLSAKVERVWPNQIKVELQLKPLLLVFFEGKKKVRVATMDGSLLPSMDLKYAPDVPFVRNPVFLKNEEVRKQIISFYQAVPDEGVISKPEVAEIDWSDTRGLILEMSHGIEGQIVLGLGDVNLKAKRVANVLKYLESQNQKWRVIDASFAKKVLVRLRKHS
jgi:cell division protein FtsQ